MMVLPIKTTELLDGLFLTRLYHLHPGRRACAGMRPVTARLGLQASVTQPSEAVFTFFMNL